jgi:hypothetical protein
MQSASLKFLNVIRKLTDGRRLANAGEVFGDNAGERLPTFTITCYLEAFMTTENCSLRDIIATE